MAMTIVLLCMNQGKRMNNNAIKQIYEFNKQAGLLKQQYLDERECAYPIEEALEGFDLYNISGLFPNDKYENNPKEVSRLLSHYAAGPEYHIQDVDRLDKHLDIIVFSLGSIFKLGLNPQEAMKALAVVASKNMEKLKAGQDEAGKQKKPSGFVGPEAELQKILDGLK